MTQTRMSVRAAAVASAAAVIAVLLVVLAPASAGAATATIDMKGKTDRGLKFKGPEKVERGDKLEIVNSTDPRKVGPHTFTLLEKNLIPKNETEGEACFGPDGICGQIFEAHEIDEESETVGKPDIDVGKKGWDVEFAEGKTGDSWFTFAEDETTKRKIKAKAGTRLGYFCVIHPWMAGSIKVK